jgi:hypothetical protein
MDGEGNVVIFIIIIVEQMDRAARGGCTHVTRQQGPLLALQIHQHA